MITPPHAHSYLNVTLAETHVPSRRIRMKSLELPRLEAVLSIPCIGIMTCANFSNVPGKVGCLCIPSRSRHRSDLSAGPYIRCVALCSMGKCQVLGFAGLNSLKVFQWEMLGDVGYWAADFDHGQ